MSTGERARISNPDIVAIDGYNPFASVPRLGGIRIHDVGQGDSVSVLDGDGNPVIQFDYGGRQGHPFANDSDVDARMPVIAGQLMMISHWDEDHWCSARKSSAARQAFWLVPRQITSPRAVKFSKDLDNVRCIPESHAGRAFRFTTLSGDALWWEKIAAGPAEGSTEEDCNRTGVAFSIVRQTSEGEEVMLLPGDAPFDKISHYWQHLQRGAKLRGLIAFHHGAATHWTNATKQMLEEWGTISPGATIVFSCARENSYNHPSKDPYAKYFPRGSLIETAKLRDQKEIAVDLTF